MLNFRQDQEYDSYPKPGSEMQMHNDPASELASMLMASGKVKGKEKGKPSKGSMQCYSCAKFGHMARDCRAPKGRGK